MILRGCAKPSTARVSAICLSDFRGSQARKCAIAAHEQVKTVLHADQFLAVRDHRAHRASVRASQLGAFLINHGAVRQRFIEAIVLLERLDARRLPGRLGDIEEQILINSSGAAWLIPSAPPRPAAELLVHLPQQGANRCTVAYTTTGQPFDQPRRDLPRAQPAHPCKSCSKRANTRAI